MTGTCPIPMACRTVINSLLNHATFKISVNFVKYIVQLSKDGVTFRNISCYSGMMYIFGNMYNDLRKVAPYFESCTIYSTNLNNILE